MLTEERKTAIMTCLRRERSVTVRALAKELYVSEATVRRDLRELEESGMLRRSHGGAVLEENVAGEPSFLVRREENAAGKRRLAEAALPILEGSVFFLDSSSTVQALAAVWEAAHKTVITTGISTAFLFSRKQDAQVILPGGNVRYLADSVGGATTLRQLERFRADVCLCSCGGILPDGSLTESTAESGEIKATMLRRAERRILLADHSKWGRVRAYSFATLREFDALVTDCRPPEETVRLCAACGVRLLYPSVPPFSRAGVDNP